jgi:nucleoside-diphosphate-sugar epimerase
VDRDTPDALAALAGERFDAVVDVAAISYPWVAEALRVLAPNAGHWTFVSTISVYADNATIGQRAGDAPVLPPLREGGTRADVSHYGEIKVASEDAVRDTVGDRAFVVRPGLITGPNDRSDRFGYWPGRFARGGRVVVPDTPDQPIQHIDVRDLAEWIVTGAEQRVTGTFDAIGPISPLGQVLREIAEVAGGAPELVPVAPDTLVAAGVAYYAGPKSLPLWLPKDHWGMKSHDPAPARQAGLRARSLAETVEGALATERELGLDRDRRAGLSRAEEEEILAGRN